MKLPGIVRSLVPPPLVAMKRQLFRRRDGDRLLRERFRLVHGYKLPMESRTFSEKLYHRMITVHRDGNETFTRLTNKFLVRDYVRKAIGEQYLVPLLWQGFDPRKIPIASLPGPCIAKTNHGSGGHLIIDQTSDEDEVASKLKASLSFNHYWTSREYQYYAIKPRIIVEKLLDDGEPSGPLDYRFWCFHGRPAAIQTDNNAHSMNAFYTPSWEWISTTYRATTGTREAKRPANLDHMLEIAEKLSRSFDFVRVDLYNVGGNVYFGEMTFTPTAGRHRFDPPEWDEWFGQKWCL